MCFALFHFELQCFGSQYSAAVQHGGLHPNWTMNGAGVGHELTTVLQAAIGAGLGGSSYLMATVGE